MVATRHPAPYSIGESLQEYAARTGRTTASAYPDWHAHGDSVAAEWADRVPENPDRAVLGGRSLGLLASDVGSMAGERHS